MVRYVYQIAKVDSMRVSLPAPQMGVNEHAGARDSVEWRRIVSLLIRWQRESFYIDSPALSAFLQHIRRLSERKQPPDWKMIVERKIIYSERILRNISLLHFQEATALL